MSVVQVMGGGRGNLATDRTPFYGIKLPDEVKKSVAILKQIDQDGFRKILKRKKGFSSCFSAINWPSVITFFMCSGGAIFGDWNTRRRAVFKDDICQAD